MGSSLVAYTVRTRKDVPQDAGLSRERRRLRYRRRNTGQRLRAVNRLSTCGRRMVSDRVAVALGEGVAHFNGLQSCGSVWACGVCSPKIRQRRSVEIGQGLAVAEDMGLGLAFLTLTVQHHAGDSLQRVYSLQEAAWRALQQSRAWKECMADLGVRGHIVFREVTYGQANGWHPHRHIVLVLDRPVGAAELVTWQAKAWAAWQHQLSRRGLSSSELHGLDVRSVRSGGSGGVGWYVAKVAAEMTRGDLKRARGAGHFTPEQLLDLVAEDGEAWAADAWREYARVTAGRRMLTWSVGLRALLALPEEASNEEVAAEVVGGEVVALVSKDGWRALLRSGEAVTVLEAAEASRVDLWAALAALVPAGSFEVLEAFEDG